MNLNPTNLLLHGTELPGVAGSGTINVGLETILSNIPDRIFIKDRESRFVKINEPAAKRLGLAHPDLAVGKSDFDFMPPEKAREFWQDEQHIIRTGEPLINKAEKQILPTGEIGWTSTTKVPLRDPAGNIVGLMGFNRDITELVRTEEALRRTRDELELRVASRTADLAQANLELHEKIRQNEEIQKVLNHSHQTLRTLVDTLPDIIFIKDTESRFQLVNAACAAQLGLSNPEEAVGKSDADFVTAELASRYRADEVSLMESGKLVHQEEPTLHKATGKIGCSLTTKLSVKDADGKIIGVMGIARDITPLKDAEKKLEEVHKNLVDAARAAGMAEVAIGVLHNVGNVLNSVNVSAGFICDALSNSKIKSLSKVMLLLREHAGNLQHFLTEDERGRQVLPYLEKLVLILQEEHEVLQRETKDLDSKIKHIAEIIAAQQSHARFGGLVETLSLEPLVEDALKIHGAGYLRHGITLVREFAPIPPVPLDKHKVLQILVNLFRNAKEACESSDRPDKQVTIQIQPAGPGRVKIEVADNGIGILPENLTRIFSQGFTTRKDGHGFGLHSGALDARELGGTLSVQSDGPGKGATFTLELPTTPGPVQ